MAQPDILLDLDQLRDNAIATTTTSLTTIDDQMNTACDIVGTLTVIGWTGTASEAFMNSFTEYKKQMRILYENLTALQEAMNSIDTQGNDVFENGNKLLSTLS